MKIYVDLIFLLNFSFDFMLLLCVSVLLHRRAPLYRVALGAFIGALTIFCLFIPLSSLALFALKFIVSIFMILATFSFKNIRYLCKNVLYLYIVSVILGGFLYYANIQFSYKQDGLIFYHHGVGSNLIILVLISPFILYNYVKQESKRRHTCNYYYHAKIFYRGRIFPFTGYLDTGNVLEDPYFHKPITIINAGVIPEELISKCIYVPVSTVSGEQLMKCFFVQKIEIEGIGVRKHMLVGISKEAIVLDGVDMLLQSRIMEG